MGAGDRERRDPTAGWYPDPAGGDAQRYWDGSSWTDAVRGSSASLSPAPTETDVTEQQPSVDSRAAGPPAVIAGWYDDPLREADYRYHDGTDWTSHTRPAEVAAAPAAERGRLAWSTLLIVGVLAVLAIGGVTIAVLLAGGNEPTLAGEESADHAGQNSEVRAESNSGELPEDGGDIVDPDPDPATDGDGSSTPEEDAAGQASDDAGLDPDGDRTLVVDFDGVCKAKVRIDELEQGSLRAWHVGCASAPVDLVAGESRWIIVVASLNGADFDIEDAQARAAEFGLDDQVLWSSHYPSLNPELWVVYDGPFPSEDVANDAAVDRADGSYPRVLSDDDRDRYCIAADGCRGETR